jgi:alpha-1,3-rhamnosyl/mannosyltransferase
MRALYRSAHFLVFPTLFEGWGFPLFEAFESGLPVACSHATCLPELARDAALLFDPQDPSEIASAIDRISSDVGFRSSLVEKGRRRAQLFTWENSAREHRALYRKISGAE